MRRESEFRSFKLPLSDDDDFTNEIDRDLVKQRIFDGTYRFSDLKRLYSGNFSIGPRRSRRISRGSDKADMLYADALRLYIQDRHEFRTKEIRDKFLFDLGDFVYKHMSPEGMSDSTLQDIRKILGDSKFRRWLKINEVEDEDEYDDFPRRQVTGHLFF